MVAPVTSSESIHPCLTFGLLLVSTKYLAPRSTIHVHIDCPTSPDKPRSRYVRSERNIFSESTGRTFTNIVSLAVQSTIDVGWSLLASRVRSLTGRTMKVPVLKMSVPNALKSAQAALSSPPIMVGENPGQTTDSLLKNGEVFSILQFAGKISAIRLPIAFVSGCTAKSTKRETLIGSTDLISRGDEPGWT